jgi:C-terminal processing protease CtpA/Prc
MINLDMVGRLSEKKPLQVYGNGTALELDSIVKVHLKKYTFQPIYHPGGTGPSDHASFYSKNIPVLFFMTDLHTDYHTPSDTPDKINYQGMEEIASLAFDIVTDIANRPKALTFKEVDSPAETTSARPYKVSIGIMPDFASTDNSGVRVDAVTKGRPAEKGGILKGDVIISINGAPVKNIQDYMFQLGKCNSGDKVKVEVKRTDRTVLLEVQL